MTVTDLRTPPPDPLALQVAARLDVSVDAIGGALDDMRTAITAATEAVGHARPLTSGEQARLIMAGQHLAQALGAYQTLALLEQSQRGGGVVVPLGLAEPGLDHQQAFPPCGTSLRTETVSAGELVPGDRAVPVEHMVVGPAKDAFRHFHLIDAVGSMGDQVVLGWGGEDHVVAVDWPFTRITSGRLVGQDGAGDEVASYEWEVTA